MIRLSLLLAAFGLALLVAPLIVPPTVPPTPPEVAPTLAVAHGRALFSAKGCAQCHRHVSVPGSGAFRDAYGADGAPDLSIYRWDDAYLRRWLANPSAVKPDTNMPDLELKPGDIELLVLFLKSGQRQP
jgi:cytochrome c2